MKYGVVIMDGAADAGVEALEGRTPLEAASAPTLARIARVGRVGVAVMGVEDEGFSAEACVRSLLGFAPGAMEEGGLPVRHGVRAVMITAGGEGERLARGLGMDVIMVSEGAELEEAGAAACAAVAEYDLVCCRVGAADRACDGGDAAAKVAEIEAVDRLVLAPLLERLEAYGNPAAEPGAAGWRVLVAPTYARYVETGERDGSGTLFAMAGAWVRSAVERGFNEREAAGSDLVVDPGHELLEYFLRGGLARVPARMPRVSEGGGGGGTGGGGAEAR